MGIRGLTTYIARRADSYLDHYELHDTYVVIDGNSLASQLYCHQSKCNSAFGGDYDVYANCVTKFFHTLKKCNISPLVIFDGGYELRKWSTIKCRLRTKIMNAGNITPVTQSRIKAFPLMMKEVFKDVMKELHVPCVQSLYEADDEIAAIARQMECPVLSYDSDFFVYDVLYIPFDTLSVAPSSKTNRDGTVTYYLGCCIYRVEKFLNSFGGLQKTLLPVMAALLGNDYIKKSVFSNFLSQIKKPKSRTMNETQRGIAGLLQWLRGETFETAISKILNHLKKKDRKYVAEQIQKIFAGYVQCSSNLLPLLGIEIIPSSTNEENTETLQFLLTEKNLSDEDPAEVIEENLEDQNMNIDENQDSPEELGKEEYSDYSSDEEPVEDESLISIALPSWFVNRFQAGEFSPALLDIITHRTYFLSPQVDDNSLCHSHAISLPIIQVIFGLLIANQGFPDDVCLIYYARDKHGQPKKFSITPVYKTTHITFPQLDNLQDLSEQEREMILLETLNFSLEERQIIQQMPPHWRLYLLTLIFWAKHCTEPALISCHVQALLFCLISLNVVDNQVGYHRVRRTFMKKKSSELKNILAKRESESNNSKIQKDTLCVNESNSENVDTVFDQKVTDALSSVSSEDCLLLAETFMPFHQIDEKLKSSAKLFSTSTVHAFAQFESCLFHIMQLNALLGFPFLQCQAAQFYSGLFVYNAFTNFKKRTDALAYIMLLMSQTPSLANLFRVLHQCVMELLPNISFLNKNKRKHRRNKVRAVSVAEGDANTADDIDSPSSEDEDFVDTNNKFSALTPEN